MAKIGKSTVGLTDFSASGSSTGYATGPYEVSEDGVIDDISVYTESTGVSVVLAVYLHDEAQIKPTTMIAATGAISVTTPGWQTGVRASGTGAIQQGKRYWVYALASGDVTYKLDYTEEKWWYNQSGPYPTIRNPWLTGGGATLTRAISAYFNYTPAVHDAGDTSIQGLINRASSGATVKIPYGFYNERVVINKTIKLVGVSDRRGRMPIIQGGDLVTGWTQSTAPEHSGKNVWYKDWTINGGPAVWIRSLMLDDDSVQVLQANPSLSGEGATESQATTEREYVLSCEWSQPGHFLVAGQTIDFWQWYDAIACHDTSGRIWLRLKNGRNPNNSTCYLSATLNARSSDNDDWNYTNEQATVISAENQSSVTIQNLEIRGGRRGVDVHNCSNVLIEKCKFVGVGLRHVAVTNCTNVTIQKDEFTANPTRTNIGPGFGGTTDRAKAMMFGWSLNKNYTVSGLPSPTPHGVELIGVTSNVSVKRNWMHGMGSGVAWGFGFDAHVIDAVIEGNKFETMDSTGVIIYSRSGGTVRNNDFYEVHLNFRIQDMMESATMDALERLVTIESNRIRSLESAGYCLQAHYAGTHATYVWTSPIVFNENFVQNVSHLIANLLGFAEVSMDGNVIDTASTFQSAVITHGMTEFDNNWVGGNASTGPSQLWWGDGNDYVLDQRLVGVELPGSFEEVGPYRQNVGLPIRRSPKTYAEMTKRG